MFERFTDRARRVVTLAHEEARELGHNYIGTEHILLGLTHEGEGVAGQALKSLGISLSVAHTEVKAIIGTGPDKPTGHIPFTPRAKKVLELSLREALQLGHNYIGTEHILLGLIREGEGLGCQILVKLGGNLPRVRQQVIEILGVPTRSTKKPAPTPMKHDTPENKAIADGNTILRIRDGSRLHGTGTGTADHDEMGICIEPPSYVIGLNAFEQYEHRPKGQHAKSQPGDLDYTNYALRKAAKLMAKGNPNLILALFATGADILEVAWPGHDLRARRYMFLSRAAAAQYIGYLEGQRNSMLGKHADSFDNKIASHALRIGMQGVELLSTGVITLPVPELDRTTLVDIRLGKHSKDHVMDLIESYRHRLVALSKTSRLPERPDYPAINTWLSETYLAWWDEHR